ncbi:hypothetical protein B0H10DRAFT_2211126 [Mycena sp. CBHHK59/15]|nr:hypothetical protein B0H10DRAFT_2211126 [Mycena sp. CBHHK59/15]
MASTYDWGDPNLEILAPPTIAGSPPGRKPKPWHSPSFNPMTFGAVLIFATESGVFNSHRSSFLASDIAWHVAGASEDNKHAAPAEGGFFPDFDILRNSLPADDAVVNEGQATMWDRTFGSTTMILHIDGTTLPGTPPRPEYLRTSVYLPPSFVHGNPTSHSTIAQIAQQYLEAVGVPTVLQWKANADHRGWCLTPNGSSARPNCVPQPNRVSPNTLIPPPKSHGSAHYIFRGHPAGWIPDTVAPTTSRSPPSAISSPAALNSSPVPTPYTSEDPEYTSDALALIDSIGDVQSGKARLQPRQSTQCGQEQAIYDCTIKRNGKLELEIKDLRAQLAAGAAEEIARLDSALKEAVTERLACLQSLIRAQAREEDLSFQVGELLDREQNYSEQIYNLQTHITSLQAQLDVAEQRTEAAEQRAQSLSVQTAQTPRKPPSYSTASQSRSLFATPTRAPPIISTRSPSPKKNSNQISMAAFLAENGLDAKQPALEVTMRHVPVAKWYEELARMDITGDIASCLLDCMNNEAEHL